MAIEIPFEMFVNLREGLSNILDEIQSDEEQECGFIEGIDIPGWKIREARLALDAINEVRPKA